MSANPTMAGLDPESVFPELSGRTREEVLRDISRRLAQTGAVRDGEDLARRLIEREGLGCTGLGGGIAIPHCKLKSLSQIVVAVGRLILNGKIATILPAEVVQPRHECAKRTLAGGHRSGRQNANARRPLRLLRPGP